MSATVVVEEIRNLANVEPGIVKCITRDATTGCRADSGCFASIKDLGNQVSNHRIIAGPKQKLLAGLTAEPSSSSVRLDGILIPWVKHAIQFESYFNTVPTIRKRTCDRLRRDGQSDPLYRHARRPY